MIFSELGYNQYPNTEPARNKAQNNTNPNFEDAHAFQRPPPAGSCRPEGRRNLTTDGFPDINSDIKNAFTHRNVASGPHDIRDYANTECFNCTLADSDADSGADQLPV
ncbi:hypothetical protein EYZ11_013159 [Aspergillus tanneri]|uniref:Uncharacterized protein n=1 Tax=Aspergillus tanneri TaxID=1220188 RepID=A0A4S3IYD4_9EURO|nr:hypothetical protein EYZ11_013159 [Aspergillus tanneri]